MSEIAKISQESNRVPMKNNENGNHSYYIKINKLVQARAKDSSVRHSKGRPL